MLGIESLKKAVKLGLDFTKQISEAFADQKFQITEIFGFVDEFAAVPGVVKSWKDISAELKELSKEERLELHAYIAGEFDIPNDKLEIFIENALLQVVSLVTLVEEFKLLKTAP